MYWFKVPVESACRVAYKCAGKTEGRGQRASWKVRVFCLSHVRRLCQHSCQHPLLPALMSKSSLAFFSICLWFGFYSKLQLLGWYPSSDAALLACKAFWNNDVLKSTSSCEIPHKPVFWGARSLADCNANAPAPLFQQGVQNNGALSWVPKARKFTTKQGFRQTVRINESHPKKENHWQEEHQGNHLKTTEDSEDRDFILQCGLPSAFPWQWSCVMCIQTRQLLETKFIFWRDLNEATALRVKPDNLFWAKLSSCNCASPAIATGIRPWHAKSCHQTTREISQKGHVHQYLVSLYCYWQKKADHE